MRIYFATLMSLISPNFDVKSIFFFPDFGHGPFLPIAGKGPATEKIQYFSTEEKYLCYTHLI